MTLRSGADTPVGDVTPTLSRIACVVAVVLFAVSVVLRVLAQTAGGHDEIASPFSTVLETAASATFLAVAVLLVLKRPRNPIGWLLLIPLDFLNAYAEYTLLASPESGLPGGEIAAAADLAAWTPFVAIVVLLLLLFPSGSFSSPRWRRIGLVAAGAAAVTFVHTVLAYRKLDPPYEGHENPLGLLEGREPFDPFGYLVVFPLMLLVPVAAVDLFRRFRRSRGEERQQFRWLAFSGALIVGYFPLYVALGMVADELAYTLFTLVLVSLPVSIAVAVLKYRLYEIDRVVSRTLVYTTVTVLLVAAYAGLVLAGQAVFSSFAGGSDLAIAVSTLVVAALFLPLRSRVQRFVDRRFYRTRFDARRTVDAFGARLREQVELDGLRADLVRAVGETMQPAHVALWLRREGST